MKRSTTGGPGRDRSPEAVALAGSRVGKSLREIAVDIFSEQTERGRRRSRTERNPRPRSRSGRAFGRHAGLVSACTSAMEPKRPVR